MENGGIREDYVGGLLRAQGMSKSDINSENPRKNKRSENQAQQVTPIY